MVVINIFHIFATNIETSIMKAKFFTKLMALTFILMPFVISGCGSDDNEDDGGTVTNGVHRIEVSFDGNYSQFTPVLLFSGIKQGGAMSLVYDQAGNAYENIYNVDYQGGTVTAYSESSCFEFYVSIMLSNVSGKAGSVNISCKGYVDGKVKNYGTKSVTFSENEMAKAAYFNSVDGFRDVSPSK